MDIRATRADHAYQAARPALAPTVKGSEAGKPLAQAAEGFVAALHKGETAARNAAIGKADPQALVMALSQTELAVETAATLRDRVVEAYQEILRMPV